MHMEPKKSSSKARSEGGFITTREDVDVGEIDDMEEDEEEEFHSMGDGFGSKARPASVDEEVMDDEAELNSSDDERVEEFVELMKRYAVQYAKTLREPPDKRRPEDDVESPAKKRARTVSPSGGPRPRRSAANSPPATVRPHGKGPAYEFVRSSPQRKAMRTSQAQSLASPENSERGVSPTRDSVDAERLSGLAANDNRAHGVGMSKGRGDEEEDVQVSVSRVKGITRIAREQVLKEAATAKKARHPRGVWQPREREVVEDADVDHVDGNIPRAVHPKRERFSGRKRWTNLEVAALEEGMNRFGPDWKKIVAVYGTTGTGELAGRTNVNLKDKARNVKRDRLKQGLDLGAFEDATD
ncbi:hypothetical protein HK101_008944 [Irineochytrium annulatum]|nr:hypothetical protein HK101_008944 [Irineochytrium annulatum]